MASVLSALIYIVQMLAGIFSPLLSSNVLISQKSRFLFLSSLRERVEGCSIPWHVFAGLPP